MKKYLQLYMPMCVFCFFVACTVFDPVFDDQSPESGVVALSFEEPSLKSANTYTIQISGSFDVQMGEIPPGTEIDLAVEGVGNAKLLGKTFLKMDKTVSINQFSNKWDSSAEITLQTNNSSEIRLMYAHSEVDLSESPLMHFNSVCKIINGTGRFSGIKGFIVFQESLNWQTSIGTIEVDGEIEI